MREKVKDALMLLRSRAYLIVTERRSSMKGEFSGLEAFSVLHALNEMKKNLNKEIKDFEAIYFGGKERKNGKDGH